MYHLRVHEIKCRHIRTREKSYFLTCVNIYRYMIMKLFSYMLCLFCKKHIGELNLKRALDEDTGVFSIFLLSFSPLGQTAVSGNSTLHQLILGVFVFFLILCESLALYAKSRGLMYTITYSLI